MAKCYNSNGTPDTGRIPCSADGNPAQCCGQGEICTSNGLCMNIEENGQTNYWLNTCTDPEWGNKSVPTCPSQCAHHQYFGGNGVRICGKGTFCCSGFSSCNCSDSETFTLGSVRAVTALTISPSSAPAITESSSPTPAPSGSSGKSESGDNLDVGLGVGLGVGIPVVFGVIAAFWFFRRRRSRAAASLGPTEAVAPSLQKNGTLLEQVATVPMTREQGPPQELATSKARPHLELQ